MTTDPLAWVRAEMDAAEEVALGAKGQTLGRWKEDDGPAEDIDLYAASGKLTMGQARHIARHDPAAVLRRIKAERELLDDLLAERHEVVEGDCWYTCAAATEEHDGGETCDDTRRGKPCDCGRDARVERRIRLIAEGWGWTEGT